MASLEVIDEIVDEISKIRGVDMPPICIKLIVLTYWLYCVNTYNVKYENECGETTRPNSGCIILCDKGTGKSRTLKALSQIFSGVEQERQKRYLEARHAKVGMLENSMIPLTAEQRKQVDDFNEEHGDECVGVINDTITNKGLCSIYAQGKCYNVSNLLFVVDEAGQRVFKEAASKNPSISAKEFVSAILQLYDGYCGMGQSKASKNEGLKSQYDVGANFIFISTAEFLKDYHVQQSYESLFLGGFARRFLYVNCPPIDKHNTSRQRYNPDFSRLKAIADSIDIGKHKGLDKGVSEELWVNTLEKRGAGNDIIIDDEYLLLLFCVGLTVWTDSEQIGQKHWNYMVKVFDEMKGLSMTVVQKDTTNFDKVCVFMQEWFEKNKNRKKMPLVLIKDYCVRNKLCQESQFKRWFKNLCNEFVDANTSKFIIEKNQMYAWLEDNFAFGEGQ